MFSPLRLIANILCMLAVISAALAQLPVITTRLPTTTSVVGQPILHCRLCNRAIDLRDCDRLVACDANSEECYMDELVTDQLTIVYNGGCRSKQVCLKDSGKKKRDDLIACSKCCNDVRDCNTRLCGIRGGTLVAPVQVEIIQCRFCNRANDLSECDKLVTCDAREEACYMDELITDQLIIVYDGGCRSKQVCFKASGRKKKNDLIACSRCCNYERDCNSHLCDVAERPTRTCNVEDSCLWKQGSTDTIDWHEMAGPTQSGDTGPDNDHTLGNQNGTYYYIEASSPSKQGDYADLVSPTQSANKTRCLEFWYSMFGDGIGTLHVSIKSIGEKTKTIFIVSGNQGPGWHKSSTTILDTPYDYNIVITGNVGSTFTGDIAIDDIKILPYKCHDSSTSSQIIG